MSTKALLRRSIDGSSFYFPAFNDFSTRKLSIEASAPLSFKLRRRIGRLVHAHTYGRRKVEKKCLLIEFLVTNALRDLPLLAKCEAKSYAFSSSIYSFISLFTFSREMFR